MRLFQQLFLVLFVSVGITIGLMAAFSFYGFLVNLAGL